MENGITPKIQMKTHGKLSAAGGNEAVIGKDGDEGQLVLVAHFVIVLVVRGGDLDGASPEVHLHHLVGHDGDLPLAEGVLHRLPVILLVPRVLKRLEIMPN